MAHQFGKQAAVSAHVLRGSWRPGYVRLHWPIHRTDFAGGWLQHCAGVALEAYRRFSTAQVTVTLSNERRPMKSTWIRKLVGNSGLLAIARALADQWQSQNEKEGRFAIYPTRDCCLLLLTTFNNFLLQGLKRSPRKRSLWRNFLPSRNKKSGGPKRRYDGVVSARSLRPCGSAKSNSNCLASMLVTSRKPKFSSGI